MAENGTPAGAGARPVLEPLGPGRRSIHVVVNPASGQPEPVLHVINEVFSAAGADWHVSVTQSPDDAEDHARRAAAGGAEIVAAYGGDGTVVGVATGLLGTSARLAILPGGTANLVATELSVPADLRAAASVVVEPTALVRRVDLGRCGDRSFLVSAGVGFHAEFVKNTRTGLKRRVRSMAYLVGALESVKSRTLARYRVSFDGERFETEAVACIVANCGTAGLDGLSLLPVIAIDDGMLDVLVFRDPGLESVYAVAKAVLTRGERTEALWHARGRRIVVQSDPPQPVDLDGELAGETPLEATVLERAVEVIVPPP